MKSTLEILKEVLQIKNKDLAKILDVTPNAITEAIKGRTKFIPSKWIITLIDKFNINGNWLLTGKGTMFNDSLTYSKEHIKEETLQDIYQLPLQDRQNIYDYIEFIKYKNNEKVKLNLSLVQKKQDDDIKIPILGQIAAGSPIFAEENIEKMITIPQNIFPLKGENFGLRVRGESMIDAGILNKDIAIIKKTEDLMNINNNDIVAMLLDNEATLKYFYKNAESFILKPANKNYKPIELKEEDNPSIIGKLVGLLRQY